MRPERIVRRTVVEHGGRYRMTVAELLELFGRKQLTERTREEIEDSLLLAGIGVERGLYGASPGGSVELFVVDH